VGSFNFLVLAMRIAFATDKRGYDLSLEQDLLGDFVLTRRWYGLANNRHGQKVHLFFDEANAKKQYEKIAHVRLLRGYVMRERK
jgi:predicted DNA-binding WGR domain protein